VLGIETSVRRARLGDARSIARLVNAATSGNGGWTREAGLFEGDRTDAGEILETMAKPGVVFLLWGDGEQPWGCAFVKPLPDAGYMGMLSVRPDTQGQGRGSEIIAECERVARDEWSRRVMRISVITSHRPELAAFYERRGYVRTGRYTQFERKQAHRAPPLVEGMRLEWMEKTLEPRGTSHSFPPR
jgi:GNAT superfamily N-acetyltransferase